MTKVCSWPIFTRRVVSAHTLLKLAIGHPRTGVGALSGRRTRSEAVAQRAQGPKERNTPMFQASLPGLRVIQQAAALFVRLVVQKRVRDAAPLGDGVFDAFSPRVGNPV